MNEVNNWEHIGTFYAYEEERVVNTLIDSDIDPCTIKVEDGPEPGTVEIWIPRR